MADPVSLVTGLVPLMVTAIGAYSAIYAQFKTYRQYSRVLLRLNRQFETQHRLFLNECHFLLRMVVSDEGTIRAMLANSQHTKWTGVHINQQWKTCLDKNYDTCLRIVEEIDEKLTELSTELSRFDSIPAQRQDITTQARLNRIQSAIKMSFKKSGYEQLIEALRMANADLQILRKHLKEFQKPPRYQDSASISRRKKRRREECTQYESIRHVSRALHEALTTSWSCSQTTHLAHYAKLLLDVSVNPQVHLDLLILSDRSPPQIRLENLVRLSVRSYSQAYEAPESFVPTPASAAEDQEMITGESSHRPTEQAIERAGKTRKLFLTDDISVRSLEETMPQWRDYVDLRSSSDICSALARPARPYQELQGEETCIGYIDTTAEKYRHLFFSGNTQKSESVQVKSQGELAPVYELLSQPLDNTLTVVDQLKLDIGFFRCGDEFSDASLRSLHVTTGFSSESHDDQVCIDATEDYPKLNMSTVIEDAKFQYGIRNLPLYCLGVVLLQIGHWALVDGGDIGRIRRLAVQSCRLGPRYKNIAQRCLDCDFGFGNDLCTPQLQQAVQSSVLDELTDMIDSLDISKN
uniref:Lon protease like 2, peroxisomal n=1 Tax=Talaromyces marneffei PM1 TaxID=1077442 RepID=A0A093V9Z9_TALMA